MEQLIKRGEDLIITFTWFEDGRVYVKYFLKGKEIDSMDDLTTIQKTYLSEALKDFCNETNLILYSY